jgi:hypothetical protein
MASVINYRSEGMTVFTNQRAEIRATLRQFVSLVIKSKFPQQFSKQLFQFPTLLQPLGTP